MRSVPQRASPRYPRLSYRPPTPEDLPATGPGGGGGACATKREQKTAFGWIGAAGIVALGLGAGGGARAEGPAVAKIASLQNQVETKSSAAAGWSFSTVGQQLSGHDRVRTGPASRAAILYSDQTLHRMNEKSEIEILPPTSEAPGLLRVITGEHYFSSRTPKDYGRIETPTVITAIRGTEFVVQVDDDTTTTITMLEGVVEASNPFGTLTVAKGEQAFVEPGKAPVKRILVRPRDAVAWALYYPPVLGGSDAARLRSMGAAGEDLARAAELLGAGQVGEARPLIEHARGQRPDDPIALSLASVIEVAANRKEDAMRLAERAASADPRSAAAALALSFAAQAAFDIPRARSAAEKAAELDPESALALARAAELRMAEGDLAGARAAAEGAVGRAPDQARALSVLGFVELAQLRSAEAERQFEKAAGADPALALAHLGLGISRIRRGKVDEGREELQTAAALDPDDALLRSYLGKAYYEERRSTEAGKELAAAKELDPSDPTPYLYDAIRKQSNNRPVEALDELRASIARNHNRAVYRSQLLLDEDVAVRGSDLARIYNDLGFEQLGLVTARRSADADQANFSSHLFLAGNYRNIPGFAPAFFSEVLQSRIYQPVSVNAARPDVVNESVSFNEYTALFDRPRARAFGGLTYGRTDGKLEHLLVNDPFGQEFLGIDNSDRGAGQIVGTLNGDRFAAAAGYSKLADDGYRLNNDRSIANYRGFFEYAPTYRDSFQVNLLSGRQDTGDIPIRAFTPAFTPERFETELRNYGLGYHRILSPGADLAVSAIYNRTEQTGRGLEPFAIPFEATAVLSGPQLEAQVVLRQGWGTWIFGAGGFSGEITLSSEAIPFISAASKLVGDDTFVNGYAYAKLRRLGPVEITVGASAERVDTPIGLLPLRDSQILPADLSLRESRVSPKVGISAYLPSKTTLRAAGYYRLNPAIGRVQTLEPTQIAGFNQIFGDPGGTRSLSYGGGLDQEVGSHVFVGFSVMRRELTVPEPFCSSPVDFAGCIFLPASVVERRRNRDRLGTAYLNATIGKRVTVGIDYFDELHRLETTFVDQAGFFEDRVASRRIRPRVRMFLPFGLFAGASATRYHQDADKHVNALAPGQGRFTDKARFWTVDAQAGYLFPGRYGSIVLEGRNLTDREFLFYERALEETVIPARQVSLTANFTF